MKKRRNKLILSLLSKIKTDPYNDENYIDFKWSDVKEEEDIALTIFIKNHKSKLIRKAFQKSS